VMSLSGGGDDGGVVNRLRRTSPRKTLPIGLAVIVQGVCGRHLFILDLDHDHDHDHDHNHDHDHDHDRLSQAYLLSQPRNIIPSSL
jgi:ABC-type nickel/cobalt efflux system permease component RcnA